MRTYSELQRFKTFQDRFNYLVLPGEIGIQTFGVGRYLNQNFYRSKEWKDIRQKVILRDNGNDMGFEGRPIYGSIRVHHMNPVTIDEFEHEDFRNMLDPEYLISVSLDTHNAIHYGSEQTLKIPLVERKKGDSCPWIVS